MPIFDCAAIFSKSVSYPFLLPGTQTSIKKKNSASAFPNVLNRARGFLGLRTPVKVQFLRPPVRRTKHACCFCCYYYYYYYYDDDDDDEDDEDDCYHLHGYRGLANSTVLASPS